MACWATFLSRTGYDNRFTLSKGLVPVRVCYHTYPFLFSVSRNPLIFDRMPMIRPGITHPSNRQISPVLRKRGRLSTISINPNPHSNPKMSFQKVKTYTQAKPVVIVMMCAERKRIFVSKTPENEDPPGRVDRLLGRAHGYFLFLRFIGSQGQVYRSTPGCLQPVC